MNLAKLGETNVATFGEYPSLVFEGRELTNVDQQRAGNRLANVLRRLGVVPGDRVVVMLPNCPEVLQAYAAILKVGAVVVPVVFLLGPREVGHILAHSGARVVITSPELADRAEGFAGPLILVGGTAPGALAWEDLIAREPDRFETVDRADGDLAVILYTAGATGQPKGVALSRPKLAPQCHRPHPPKPAHYRPLGGEPLRAGPRALGPRRAAAVALVRPHAGQRVGDPRHPGGPAPVVQPRAGPRDHRAVPRAADGRRADDVRLPAQLSGRRPLRHLVDARLGLRRGAAAGRDRRAVREEVRRADPGRLRVDGGGAGRLRPPGVRRAATGLRRPADPRRRGDDPGRR